MLSVFFLHLQAVIYTCTASWCLIAKNIQGFQCWDLQRQDQFLEIMFHVRQIIRLLWKRISFGISKIYRNAYYAQNLIKITFQVSSPTLAKKSLNLSLIWSKITFSAQLWKPHHIKDIVQLEKIKCCTAKYTSNDYTSDCKCKLITVNSLQLIYWFELQDILFLVKVYLHK